MIDPVRIGYARASVVVGRLMWALPPLTKQRSKAMAEQKTVTYDLKQVTRWVLVQKEMSECSAGASDIAEFRRRDEAVRAMNALRRTDPQCAEPQEPAPQIAVAVKPLADVIAVGIDAMLSAAGVRVLPAGRMPRAVASAPAAFQYGFDLDKETEAGDLLRTLVASAYQWLEQTCFGDETSRLRRPHDIAWVERPKVYDLDGKRCISFSIATLGVAPDATA